MEEKHAGMKFTIFGSIERIRPAIEKIVRQEEFKKCNECGEPTTERICKTCQMLQQLETR